MKLINMTTAKGKQLLNFFIEEAEKHKDPFLLIHFSRIEDQYRGYESGMDVFDAMLVISHLIKLFKIDGVQLLSLMPVDEGKFSSDKNPDECDATKAP